MHCKVVFVGRGACTLSYAVDMKVRLPALGLFYDADLAVTCDERDRTSDEDFILHPKLTVEILSDSTVGEACPQDATFDRGDKFSIYKSIDGWVARYRLRPGKPTPLSRDLGDGDRLSSS
ncbi:MAG: Uma2 family endonuclease [Elainellaceae cyanobacterium]